MTFWYHFKTQSQDFADISDRVIGKKSIKLQACTTNMVEAQRVSVWKKKRVLAHFERPRAMPSQWNASNAVATKEKSAPPKQSTPSSKEHCTSPKFEWKERKEGKIVSNTNFYNSCIYSLKALLKEVICGKSCMTCDPFKDKLSQGLCNALRRIEMRRRLILAQNRETDSACCLLGITICLWWVHWLSITLVVPHVLCAWHLCPIVVVTTHWEVTR